MSDSEGVIRAMGRWVPAAAACLLLAACGGGGGGSDSGGNPPPPPPPNQAPTVDAGPDVTVVEADSVVLAATASDSDGTIASWAWSQVDGESVTLGGADTASVSFVAPAVTDISQLSFQLVVTDDDGATASDSVVVTVYPEGMVPLSVTLSGKITFDLVPRGSTSSGLDYSSTRITGAPGIRVQAIRASDDSILASGVTDAEGNYSLDVPSLTSVYVRARAQMLRQGMPSWDFSVVDNNGLDNTGTSKPVYAMDGADFDSGVVDLQVDLHAPSGWGGSSYTGDRVAAPFSVLYAVNQAVELVILADANVDFPPLVINWSPENSPDGEVYTSYYDGYEVYLLGDADTDTEEFDHPVIIHEWGHYFEDALSRSDSVGGSHTGGDVLDPRVAFGEGWGNAFQSMARNDPLYWDTSGARQGAAFYFNVDENCDSVTRWGPRGWFNECTVQSLLYDVFDGVNASESSGDTVALGFGPIYDVLVADQRLTRTVTTVHSFSAYLRNLNPSAQAGLDGLLEYHDIVYGDSLDIWGTLESNAATSRTDGLDAAVDVLPIYKAQGEYALAVGGPAVNVCVDVDLGEGDYNKLGNRQFVRFTVPADGLYQITATNTVKPGAGTPDPDMILFDQGYANLAFDVPAQTESFCSTAANTNDRGPCTNGALSLKAGRDYVLEVVDDSNISYDMDSTKIGLYCMDVELTSAQGN